MWLDRETGAKCYMLSARGLTIIWGDTPQYWSWIPLTDSRFVRSISPSYTPMLVVRIIII
jgi:hypothetical protein